MKLILLKLKNNFFLHPINCDGELNVAIKEKVNL